ncbi:hypothetical protein DLJ54_07580, partial [Corynebacterium heidelbergense]
MRPSQKFRLALLCLLSLVFTTPVALAEAPPVAVASRGHRLPIAWPAGQDPARAVVRPADIPEHNWEPGHRGVDLRAKPGQEIRASRGGRVHFAG